MRKPVTNAEFLAFVQNASGMAARPRRRACSPSRATSRTGSRPTAARARRRCRSSRSSGSAGSPRKPTAKSQGARLPTWSEWEYAAAADETRARRAQATRPGASASWPGTRGRRTQRCRAPACRPPNAYGVQDLHGLVWEWTDDYSSLLVSADNRDQGDPDNAEVLRRRRAVDGRPRELRGADARGDAVLARGRRRHRQPRLPLRQERDHESTCAACSLAVCAASCCRWSARVSRPRRRNASAAAERLGLPAAAAAHRPGRAHRRLAHAPRQAAAGVDVLHLVPVHLPADRRLRQGDREAPDARRSGSASASC